MKVSKNCIDLVKKFEGFYAKAYKCPSGYWTYGYGSRFKADGKEVKRGDTITQTEALKLLERQINEHASTIYTYVKIKLNQNQFDALSSFQYNCGKYILTKNKKLLEALNNKQWNEACKLMSQHNKSNGKVLQGLVKRRKEESKLFLTPIGKGDENNMSVTTTNRNIDSLLPVAQTAIKLFFQECHKAGIAIFVTETYRSQARQNYLYAQGRTRKGNKVTWTTKSRHTSKLAWDIAASTLKGNKDIYNTTVLKKAGAIAMKLGITWGGQPSWVKAGATDYPHFEVSSNWKIPKGYELEGKISIPTSSAKPITIVGSSGKLPQVTLEVDDSKNTINLDRGEIELKFTSPTLRDNLIKRLESNASEKMIIENAIKELGYNSDWATKETEDGDVISMAYELAIKLLKDKK